MPNPVRLAVLLVAHGTVQTSEEIPEFLRAIRRGRPPSPELISEITRRYEAIGHSPLVETTRAQAAQLSANIGCPVYVGMRFCQPSIESALAEAMRDNVTDLVVLPVAPYSVKLYTAEVTRRLHAMATDESRKPTLLTISPWGTLDELVEAHRAHTLACAKDELAAGARLLLTAHSLPRAVIAAGDRYAVEVSESANAIGVALKLPYAFAYQSAGADGGEWLGPSLVEQLDRLTNEGVCKLVVVPFGFLADHVETLYDLDLEFKGLANARGISVKRVPALGTHSGLISAFSSLVSASWSRREKPAAYRD